MQSETAHTSHTAAHSGISVRNCFGGLSHQGTRRTRGILYVQLLLCAKQFKNSANSKNVANGAWNGERERIYPSGYTAI